MENKPTQYDIEGIELTTELLDLREKLAKNVHEVWASQRMEQGWTFGKYRDDLKKTHPNLVPYEQLSEEDKDYDRNTAMETLKMIISLGYKIQKQNKEAYGVEYVHN